MKRPGFTLIELLIVIAIIAILAILALVALTSAQERSRDTKRIADMKQLEIAMELYWNETANYPEVKPGETTWTSLGTVIQNYLSTMPNDPQNGKEYAYLVNPENMDQFYVAATLENADHEALQGDVDGSIGQGWMLVSSNGESRALDAQGFNCDDAVYCLMGDATQ